MIKEDYKNEVLPEGVMYRTYNIVDEEGTIIHSNVHFEKAYVPIVTGDDFGALQINEMAKGVNAIDQKINDAVYDALNASY